MAGSPNGSGGTTGCEPSELQIAKRKQGGDELSRLPLPHPVLSALGMNELSCAGYVLTASCVLKAAVVALGGGESGGGGQVHIAA